MARWPVDAQGPGACCDPARSCRSGSGSAGSPAWCAPPCWLPSSAPRLWPTATTWPTPRRTSSTTSCSAACWRPRSIPVIVERMEADDQRSIDAIATYVITALVGVTVLGIALAPLIVRAYTIFKGDRVAADEQISIAVPLLIMFMPQVLLYGLDTLFTASAERQAALRGAGVRSGAQQHRRDLHAPGLPPGGRRGPVDPGDPRRQDRALPARHRHHRRHRGPRAGAAAGHEGRPHPHPTQLRPPEPGAAFGDQVVGVDGRLRGRQPGLAVAAEGAGERHRRGPGLGLRVRLAVLPAPVRPHRRRGDDRLHAGAVVARVPGGSPRLSPTGSGRATAWPWS